MSKARRDNKRAATPSDLVARMAAEHGRASYYVDGAGREMLSYRVLDVCVFVQVDGCPSAALAEGMERVKARLERR